MNYTEENTEYIISEYVSNPERITVERLAKELNKSPKSIIGKLSREGVYRRNVYKTKSGDAPVTKIELVSQIAAGLGIEEDLLKGLEKSPKAALKTLHEYATEEEYE
tara:strand:- start:667 stop:987 length:321 start_codon:yes stop_codon:yes gene_type:complete